jgi:hypothetical protein
MGLKALGLSLLRPYLPAEKVLSLSYPDLVTTQDELEKVWGIRTLAERPYGKWHGLDHDLPETVEAFSKMGTKEFCCVDIVASRGVEDVYDLNEPHNFGEFDLVLDAGTTEHCPNFWQATANAANAVKVGGIIMHTPPLTMLNHGFVCPQPTFYFDLYTQNGWQIEKMIITNGVQMCEAPRTNRFKVDAEQSIYVIAKRLVPGPVKYPMQSKYLKNPALK